MNTVRAPETCPTCEGEGWVDLTSHVITPLDGLGYARQCPDCRCPICGNPSQGECGECFVRDDALAVRRSDR